MTERIRQWWRQFRIWWERREERRERREQRKPRSRVIYDSRYDPKKNKE